MSYWESPLTTNEASLDGICFGTGRFLRAVLVPALTAANLRVGLIGMRSRTFLEYMQHQGDAGRGENSVLSSYPVDTVQRDGSITTDQVPINAVFSLGSEDDKEAFFDAIRQQSKPVRVIGIGVTEAGLASHETQAVKDVFDFLCLLAERQPEQQVCVINTDNVPQNGSLLQQHIQMLASKAKNDAVKTYASSRVAFLDSMVDRITSQRPGSNGMVPQAEPTPLKALVLLDPTQALPSALVEEGRSLGVVVRSTRTELAADIALKLRIANGTHTAVAHLMALLGIVKTDALSKSDATAQLLLDYLDSLFAKQMMAAGGIPGLPSRSPECQAVYDDWRQRLTHPHFGLSTFFITQNGATKAGIRLGPTLRNLIRERTDISVTMVFAFAILLRWLTPVKGPDAKGVYRGRLVIALKDPTDDLATDDASKPDTSQIHLHMSNSSDVMYADGLRYNLQEGWYEFRCACRVSEGTMGEKNLADCLLGNLESPKQPTVYMNVVFSYLKSSEGGDLADVAETDAFGYFVKAIATLYARLVAGENPLTLLKEMKKMDGVYGEFGLASSYWDLVDVVDQGAHAPLQDRPSALPGDTVLMST